jgi:hypothetical protein
MIWGDAIIGLILFSSAFGFCSARPTVVAAVLSPRIRWRMHGCIVRASRRVTFFMAPFVGAAARSFFFLPLVTKFVGKSTACDLPYPQ